MSKSVGLSEVLASNESSFSFGSDLGIILDNCVVVSQIVPHPDALTDFNLNEQANVCFRLVLLGDCDFTQHMQKNGT